jgi:hypothetical protein
LSDNNTTITTNTTRTETTTLGKALVESFIESTKNSENVLSCLVNDETQMVYKPANQFKKGEYIVLKGHPCRLADISQSK